MIKAKKVKDKNLLSVWINSMKDDFPEYSNQIDQLDLNMELVEHYYLCKKLLQMIEKSQKTHLAEEYRNTLAELKDEIHKEILNAKKDSD